ncbi:MAG: TfoX/Sxy family protein [Gammaproteobacteria bacterium]|nr:TfoX/Sxy family protein [Gammaproteobacteria bacterium]
MPVTPDYLAYVQDQLAPLGGISTRRMFGGIGIYREGLFFALIDDDELYFKVDDATRPAYVAADMPPFQPFGEDKPMNGYYRVPPEVLEDADELAAWARKAQAVAGRAAARKPPAKRRAKL